MKKIFYLLFILNCNYLLASVGEGVSKVGTLSSITSSITFFENFEDNELHDYITISSTGTFNESPGIKEQDALGSTKAYGFGISTCSANCFDSYVTDLKITFPTQTYVENLTFKEIELFGDWGSKGQILIDNVLIDSTFGSKPGNDNLADTNFKVRNIPINKTINSITIRVRDITNQSEIFIDDLNIYFENDISEGLIAYYPFNGNANDESGNKYNGTNNGADYSTDRFNNENSAMYFDGVDDYIELPDLPLKAFPFSISFAMNATEKKRHYVYTSDKWDRYWGDYEGFNIAIDENGAIFAGYGNNRNDANRAKTGALQTLNGEWNIISIVFEDYHDIKIYFNGQIQQTTESQPNLTSVYFSNKNDKIGAGDDNRHNFHGYLDDFYFFDRILTEDDVKDLNLITNIEDFVSKNTLKSSNYLFHQNYPNPFNPTTKISFSIPENGLVLLTIYDVLGNVVDILESSFKNAGTYSYSFNAKNLSSGTYFYKIRINNFVETKKMLLVK